MLCIARHHGFALPAPIPHDRPYADTGSHTVLCLAYAGAVAGDRRSLDTGTALVRQFRRRARQTLTSINVQSWGFMLAVTSLGYAPSYRHGNRFRPGK